MIREIVWVACGGACGAVTRYAVAMASAHWLTPTLPLGTLIVNVAGCFALGVLSEYHLLKELQSHWRLAVGVGFLGSLTTFSTFGHETFRLWEKGHSLQAVGNVAVNLVAGLVAVVIGIQVVRMWIPADVGG
jgi:CrcB protein